MKSEFEVILKPYIRNELRLQAERKNRLRKNKLLASSKHFERSKHIEKFHTLIEYALKLHREEDIDEKTFNRLIREIAADFVEQEVTERVESVLEERISQVSIERLLELL